MVPITDNCTKLELFESGMHHAPRIPCNLVDRRKTCLQLQFVLQNESNLQRNQSRSREMRFTRSRTRVKPIGCQERLYAFCKHMGGHEQWETSCSARHQRVAPAAISACTPSMSWAATSGGKSPSSQHLVSPGPSRQERLHVQDPTCNEASEVGVACRLFTFTFSKRRANHIHPADQSREPLKRRDFHDYTHAARPPSAGQYHPRKGHRGALGSPHLQKPNLW